MNKKLCNVTKVCTSYQDRRILILDVFVDLEDGRSLSVFDMCLDSYDEDKKERLGAAYGCEMIRQTLDFFGVDDLSQIKDYKCYLLTNKVGRIQYAREVLGLEQLPSPQFKHQRQQIIKAEVLSQFSDS